MRRKGVLIDIEGLDSCGKETQTKLLAEYLRSKGIATTTVSFPDYEDPSCFFVKEYLGKSYGDNPSLVNPYTASTFYALNRYHTYIKKWKESYDRGDVIIADRYVNSNLIHQLSKCEDDSQRNAFVTWLYDLEFNRNEIPRPSVTIFLDMNPDISDKLCRERAERTGTPLDLHESNRKYLRECYAEAKKLSSKLGWEEVTCYDKDGYLPIDTIHQNIIRIVEKYI